jgi:hypothetical protein
MQNCIQHALEPKLVIRPVKIYSHLNHPNSMTSRNWLQESIESFGHVYNVEHTLFPVSLQAKKPVSKISLNLVTLIARNAITPNKMQLMS